MISSFSKVDEYGFERPDDFDYKAYEAFMSRYMAILARRAIRWNLILTQQSLPDGGTMKRFVRKGVPAQYRGKVWMMTSGANFLKSRQPNLYQDLVGDISHQSWDEIIQNDLNRTYPDNIYFVPSSDGKLNSLYNILRASARHNTSVGYCQGLNYVAGLLLIATKDEEQSFWLLTVLIRNILPSYYSSNMQGLITDIAVLGELVRLKSSKLDRLLKDLNLPWPILVTKWFICLFAEVLPVETVLRVWDCMFNEGSKIIFRVALTLIKMNEKELLRCTDFGDMAELFKQITRSSSVLDCHQFIEVAMFKLPGSLSSSKIDSLRVRFRQVNVR
ncbi:Growth hormone-regulated TBC protein 1-A [Daphnia magna]|uniref:Growth hormone-regulated TBC protein 1 n=1 Tax=Daphnia magna TaxID=35525 RepID=A0A162S407_9CRUS|nr:Growth hormone-regulated TBC protein 1-A [Daphnia magna]